MNGLNYCNLSITGISVGMVYALIALGFVLIWKSSSVANLALGQIVLISAWFTYSMLVDRGLPAFVSLFRWSLSLPLFLGWVIERFALRPLIGAADSFAHRGDAGDRLFSLKGWSHSSGRKQRRFRR